MLLVVDMAAVIMAFFVFDRRRIVFLGLMAKSLVIDDVIENINLCKCFSIICDDPGPICDYIINGLNRSATVYEAQGAFTHHRKTVVLTTMKRSQALKLRNYIRASGTQRLYSDFQFQRDYRKRISGRVKSDKTISLFSAFLTKIHFNALNTHKINAMKLTGWIFFVV